MGKYVIGVLSFLGMFSSTQANSLPASCLLFQGQEISTARPLALSGHQVVLKSCVGPDGDGISIREFQTGGKNYGLLLNPQSLQTQIVDLSCIQCADIHFEKLPESNYRSAIKKQMAQPFPLSNKGIAHAEGKTSGYFLSVDLCPSKKRFDANIFDNTKLHEQKKFPVAVAITGGWMHHYRQDFEWLKSQQLAGNLDITWVNHSYSHPYIRGLENNRNFLLHARVNFADEVLKQEQYMISNGLTPSVFFRFPGLISNQDVIKQLSSYGLLSLGSDAWLANGQRPQSGSVILIHGNGNEPQGVELFLRLLNSLGSLEIFRPLRELF